MSTARPRIGVVGTGWWGTQYHIPALVDYQGAQLVALADPDAGKLTAAAEHFGIATTFADPAELFTSGQVDGVVIAVPHAYHYPLAKAALDAGVHVLVEKPMVLKAAQAWDLVRTADRRGLHLMVGYTYQFTRAARRVREAIQSGRIGELIGVSALFSSSVEFFYRGSVAEGGGAGGYRLTGPGVSTYSDPDLGGGQGQTQVTHAMGMVLWATGRRVLDASAYMNQRDLAVDLVDAIAYRMDNGAVGTMTSTGSLEQGQPKQQEFRYYGTEGFVLQELAQGTVTVHVNDGDREAIEPLTDEERYPTHATGRALADLIAGRGENLAPGEPAARTVEFLEASYLSARTGRSVRIDDLLKDGDPA